MKSSLILVSIIFLLFLAMTACDKGEPPDFVPDQEVGIEVSDDGTLEYSCESLGEPEGMLVSSRKLICGNDDFAVNVDCDEACVRLLENYEDLSDLSGQTYEDGSCYVDFENEMVVGTWVNFPCSGELIACEVRDIKNVYTLKYIQDYYCTNENDAGDLHSDFLVLPRSAKDILVDVHRFFVPEED